MGGGGVGQPCKKETVVKINRISLSNNKHIVILSKDANVETLCEKPYLLATDMAAAIVFLASATSRGRARVDFWRNVPVKEGVCRG